MSGRVLFPSSQSLSSLLLNRVNLFMIQMMKNGRFRRFGVMQIWAAWWKLSNHFLAWKNGRAPVLSFAHYFQAPATPANHFCILMINSCFCITVLKGSGTVACSVCKSSWWKLPNHFCILNSSAFASLNLFEGLFHWIQDCKIICLNPFRTAKGSCWRPIWNDVYIPAWTRLAFNSWS